MLRPLILESDPSLQTARLIADQFNVSLTAAAIRMLLETRHECFLVVSKAKRVQWWLSSSDRFGLWLESQQPLTAESLAYHLTEDTSDPDKAEMFQLLAGFCISRHRDPSKCQRIQSR